MSHEMVDYDAVGKKAFGTRHTPWVARWLLTRPPKEVFYPMLFRHELGYSIVHEAGLRMPDVESGVRNLRDMALITRVEGLNTRANQHNYKPVISDNWDPFLKLWLRHVERHPGEIAISHSVTLSDELQREFPPPEHRPEILSELSTEDLGRLSEILSGAFDSIKPEEVTEFLPQAIQADNADVLVSRNASSQIASVMIVNAVYGAGKIRGRIDDVATHEDSRRQGHAGAVLDYALQWFRDRGVSRVSLTSSNKRQAAHELYKSRGFTVRDTNSFKLDLE
jgi:ribosomal protein S18 acetylase RimI-like enzyme